MAWSYQVEYRLGARGGRVTRTYGGVRARFVIAFDLMLGLVFGAIGLVFRGIGWMGWLAWNLLRLVVIAVREILVALGRFARAAILLPWRTPRRLPAKPAWVAFDEL